MDASVASYHRGTASIFEDSLAVRVRGEQAQWARAQDAADEALQQARGVVLRTRAELTRSHGRTLLLTQPQQRQQPTPALAQWRLLRDPLSAAAESAEGAASAAIEAVEASRQRWEADLTRARELAARLEAAAQEVRSNLAVTGASSEAGSESVSRDEGASFSPSSKKQQHAAAYEQAAAAVGLRESSSTEASRGTTSVNTSTGSWETAVSPAAARMNLSRRQTLASSPHPVLRQTPLADRAASPHDASTHTHHHHSLFPRDSSDRLPVGTARALHRGGAAGHNPRRTSRGACARREDPGRGVGAAAFPTARSPTATGRNRQISRGGGQRGGVSQTGPPSV